MMKAERAVKVGRGVVSIKFTILFKYQEGRYDI